MNNAYYGIIIIIIKYYALYRVFRMFLWLLKIAENSSIIKILKSRQAENMTTSEKK